MTNTYNLEADLRYRPHCVYPDEVPHAGTSQAFNHRKDHVAPHTTSPTQTRMFEQNGTVTSAQPHMPSR